jgi:CubicO group peptidase (beta-lactamase class C family)
MNLLKKSIPILILLFVSNGIELLAQQETEIDGSNLAKLIEFSEATFTDEIMVVHKNKVVCHWKNMNCDSLYLNTSSMVKSWTGLVIGILIDSELISSEDDLVCQYIPEWKDGCTHKITIKNLLTMSAGLSTRRGAQGILAVEDMNDYALNVKLDTLPDMEFNYSNESVQLLGVIIEKLTGKSANEYFHEILFEPLGMDSTRLAMDPIGHDMVYGGASTTLDDAANIGMLMINGGKYDNKQIVSDSWIKKSITPSEKASFYGYLWWLDYNSEYKSFAATGDGGQLTIVFPELDLVFLRQQSCNLEISGNMTWMGPHFLKLIASVVKEK